MPNATPTPANVSLSPGGAAYLEVTIDPAAHGDKGLGSISRGVLLKTLSGQEINFQLKAEVLPGQSP